VDLEADTAIEKQGFFDMIRRIATSLGVFLTALATGPVCSFGANKDHFDQLIKCATQYYVLGTITSELVDKHGNSPEGNFWLSATEVWWKSISPLTEAAKEEGRQLGYSKDLIDGTMAGSANTLLHFLRQRHGYTIEEYKQVVMSTEMRTCTELVRRNKLLLD
jgi:hypothetical protein